jgi:hypothetical protein
MRKTFLDAARIEKGSRGRNSRTKNHKTEPKQKAEIFPGREYPCHALTGGLRPASVV